MSKKDLAYQEKFTKECSDIGYKLIKRDINIDMQNLVALFISVFLEKCKDEEEYLLKTGISVIMKSYVEDEMKSEMMNSLKDSFEEMAYEKAKENGEVQ